MFTRPLHRFTEMVYEIFNPKSLLKLNKSAERSHNNETISFTWGLIIKSLNKYDYIIPLSLLSNALTIGANTDFIHKLYACMFLQFI